MNDQNTVKNDQKEMRIPLAIVRKKSYIFVADKVMIERRCEIMDMEVLTNQELSAIKGGEWVLVDGEWIWIDENR